MRPPTTDDHCLSLLAIIIAIAIAIAAITIVIAMAPIMEMAILIMVAAYDIVGANAGLTATPTDAAIDTDSTVAIATNIAESAAIIGSSSCA